jgi:anti-anti-sigma factor
VTTTHPPTKRPTTGHPTTGHPTTGPPTTGHARVPGAVGLSVLRRPTHTIARLRGDLDVATAPALRERLAALLRPDMRLLILDLSEVGFCDAAGLAVLIGTQRRATPLDIALRLAAPRPQVAKVLHATGLDRGLSIHSTLADALARAVTRRVATARPPISQPRAADRSN